MHRFHGQITRQQLHFHSIMMHNETLNRAIHKQHHRQNQNTDDLKHGAFKCISTETSHLNECFNQHDDSDQSLQPYSRDLRSPTHNDSTINATCSGLQPQAMAHSERGGNEPAHPLAR